MKTYGNDYEVMESGRKKPFWWNWFVSSWGKRSQTDNQGQYNTNHQSLHFLLISMAPQPMVYFQALDREQAVSTIP